VMWVPELISPKHQYLINLNPFYAFIELIRAPLFGTPPTLINMMVVSIVTVIGIIVSLTIFTRYRSRIVYWL
jgi:lipopolysaccharide transport system permease protein